MSKWTHSCCDNCFNKKFPNVEAARLKEEFRDEKPDKCCFCGNGHGSGIFLRANPESTLCKGTCEHG